MKYFQRCDTRLRFGKAKIKFMRGRQDLFIFLSLFNSLILVSLKFDKIHLTVWTGLIAVIGTVILIFVWIKFDNYIHGCEIDYIQEKSTMFKEMQEQLDRIEKKIEA